MVKTIGNPASWSGHVASDAWDWAARAITGLRGEAGIEIRVRRIDSADIGRALRRGLADFGALRTDVLFLVAVYPLIGVLMTLAAFHLSLLPLVFPVAAGFALIGPVVATELYAMSKAREETGRASLRDMGRIFSAEVFAPVVVLGFYLLWLFVTWVWLAHAIHGWTLGPAPHESLLAFLGAVFGTVAGWQMIALGMGAGLVFAALVLITTLVAFPMLVDRPVGLPQAVATSLKLALRNPLAVAAWGLIVALLLLAGSLPLFVGLVIVLPVLGHATWHLYRAAVVIEDAERPTAASERQPQVG